MRKDHPLRAVRAMTDEILREMSPLFDSMYARRGRPWMPFVGLDLDEEVRDATSFMKNRDRLLEADVAKEFLQRVVEQARSTELTELFEPSMGCTSLGAFSSSTNYA